MTLKKYFLALIFISFACFAQSQGSVGSSDFWRQVRFGGGIGLGFTNGGFNGSIAPSAIYQFNPQFATGVSLSFNYAKFNDNKLLAYGGSLLSLYNPIPQIQLSAELEQLRTNRTINAFPNDIMDNYWSPALFLGVGYSTYNVTVGLRYDVLYNDEKSIYLNALMPFVRVYFWLWGIAVPG